MIEYPKIESLYNRDEKTFKFRIGEFRCAEFEYLYNLRWYWTEKIDGTNIRIGWNGEAIQIQGRTDKAQIPPHLLARLSEIFSPDVFRDRFGAGICLFGEGYGAKIQKGGGNYLPEGGCDFALCDVFIDGWWLQRHDVLDIADKLHIHTVPLVGRGLLREAEELVSEGFDSAFGVAKAEGLVCSPMEFLRNRRGDRIIVKIKTKDYSK